MVVISNQSGIGKGLFSEKALHEVNDRLCSLLLKEGTGLDRIYFCPHLPEDRCACRKPSPGLFVQAARDFDFDPKESVVIGDNSCDIDLGKRVGAATILVRTGDGKRVEQEGGVQPDYIVDNLLIAAELIVGKKL